MTAFTSSRTASTRLAGARVAVVAATSIWTVPMAQGPASTQPAAQHQQPQPPPGGRGARGGGPRIAPTPFEDRTGFETLFNGTSLAPGAEQRQKAAAAGEAGRGRGQISTLLDWEGDPKFWRVENGVIVGESTPDKVVGPNTFLIWRGGTPGDFELKAEIMMNSTNSGIQYRSRVIPANQGRSPDQPGHEWRLGGYQMDMDFANNYPGGLYEEGGRGFLAERGTVTYIAPDGSKGVIGALQSLDELKASFKPGEWNQFHIVAHGNMLVHIVNGQVASVCIDDDLKGRSMAGLIGFQLHGGPPMRLEIRNVAIKLR